MSDGREQLHKDCAESIRKILCTIWNQTHAEYFLPKAMGKHVWLTADELRTIAALFVKEE